MGNNFIPYTGNPTSNSINGIAKDLGFESEQVYTYMDFNNKDSIIQMMAFEFYSEKILFIFTSKPVSKLKSSDVKNYARGYNISNIMM